MAYFVISGITFLQNFAKVGESIDMALCFNALLQFNTLRDLGTIQPREETIERGSDSCLQIFE